MPNWVTNEIRTSQKVISSLINKVGHVDFDLIVPFPGSFDWDGISGAAEQAAEVAVGKPLDDHPLIASLQQSNRARTDIKKLDDECFEQFLQMIRNYRNCGYLHNMDFAREVWGTKWNACDSTHDADAGTARFDTAWSCPEPVLVALSKKFPDDRIEVQYADEDIGSNCGAFALLNGVKIESDEAPSWSAQSADERAKWKAFACEMKGRDPSDYDDE